MPAEVGEAGPAGVRRTGSGRGLTRLAVDAEAFEIGDHAIAIALGRQLLDAGQIAPVARAVRLGGLIADVEFLETPAWAEARQRIARLRVDRHRRDERHGGTDV